MTEDDVIRREVIRHIRTYFNVEYDFFENKYSKKFKNYFEKELNNLKVFENDDLVKISDKNIVLTPLGEHFSPQIANVFDIYNDQQFYKRII